ncbi:MAG: hypothetical protein TUN42_04355 [Dehalogenimonas sp.]
MTNQEIKFNPDYLKTPEQWKEVVRQLTAEYEARITELTEQKDKWETAFNEAMPRLNDALTFAEIWKERAEKAEARVAELEKTSYLPMIPEGESCRTWNEGDDSWDFCPFDCDQFNFDYCTCVKEHIKPFQKHKDCPKPPTAQEKP